MMDIVEQFKKDVAEDGCGDVGSLLSEIERLRAELAASHARTDSVMETLFKVCEFLGIDYEASRSAPGKPSDVIIAAITNKVAASQVLERVLDQPVVAWKVGGIAKPKYYDVSDLMNAQREVWRTGGELTKLYAGRALEVKP